MVPILFQDKKKILSINTVYFDLKGIRFKGSGVLSWDFLKGFNLNAIVKPTQSKINFKTIFGRNVIIPKKCFRFKINDKWSAISNNVFFSDFDEFELRMHSRVSTNFSNLTLFSKHYRDIFKHKNGKSLYNIKVNTVLSDKYKKSVSINEKEIYTQETKSGINIEDENIIIIGHINHENMLEINWFIKNDTYFKNKIRNIPYSIRHALSICLGQVIHLNAVEFFNGNLYIYEYIKNRDIIDLGYFAPIINNFDLDKNLFIKLFNLFINNEPTSIIIKHLYYNIADALKVDNFNIMKFMLSSSLEATLRTYYKKPLIKGKQTKKWYIASELKKFREEYFSTKYSKEWKKIFSETLNYYYELRNSPAHPDWLSYDEDDNIFDDEKDYKKLVKLTKFFGYIIIALAGMENIIPNKM